MQQFQWRILQQTSVSNYCNVLSRKDVCALQWLAENDLGCKEWHNKKKPLRILTERLKERIKFIAAFCSCISSFVCIYRVAINGFCLCFPRAFNSQTHINKISWTLNRPEYKNDFCVSLVFRFFFFSLHLIQNQLKQCVLDMRSHHANDINKSI